MSVTTFAARERRASKASLIHLVLLCAAFFIPAFRACDDETFHSAAFFARDLSDGAWLVPVFAAAAVLALITARALTRGFVSPRSRKVALAVVAGLAAVNVLDGLVYTPILGPLFGDGPSPLIALVASLVTAGLAALVVRAARGEASWAIWEHLLAAFALVSLGSGPSVKVMPLLLAGDPETHLGPGTYLFIAAQAGLLVYTLGALLRRR